MLGMSYLEKRCVRFSLRADGIIPEAHIRRPDQAWLEDRVEVARILHDSRAPLATQDVHLRSVELVELMLKRGADATAVAHGRATPPLVTCGSRLILYETTRAVI